MTMMKRMKKLLGNQKGMTLIEIMVVVTILGIIGTIATVSVMGQLDKAKVKACETQIKNFQSALDQFKLDNGFYPTTDQGLQALVEKPGGGREIKRYPSDGYLAGGSVPKDPWGNDYQYFSPGLNGNAAEIISLGADGQDGSDDNNADIKSWEIGK